MLKHLSFAVLLLAACSREVPEGGSEFTSTVARLDARLQALHRIEQDTMRNAARPEKVAENWRKWAEGRQQVDALIGKARAAATSESERNRVEQLAVLADGASARLEKVNAHVVQLSGEKR